MPFRDRVARRFAETVSTGTIRFLSTPTPFVVSFPRGPSPTVLASTDNSTTSDMAPTVHHHQDPRLGSSGPRPARHLHHHQERVPHAEIVGLDDDRDLEFQRKALGKRLLRASAIRKPGPSSSSLLKTARRARQTRATTGAAQKPPGQKPPKPQKRAATAPAAALAAAASASRRSARNASRSKTPAICATDCPSPQLMSARNLRSNSKMTDASGQQLSPSTPYLSYYNERLTYEDVRSLKNNDWLTDNNISFWQEWLEREVLVKYPQARIELLRPTVVHILLNGTDPSDWSALPPMEKVTHIFLPINDGGVSRPSDGSHWSLLLVSKIDGVAFHYSSLGGSNNNEAAKATNHLSRHLGISLRFEPITECPQQANGNDCGVFVCILMRHLLVKRLLNASAREKVSMSMSNKMIDAKGGRKEMMKIIEDLRKEAERRRSASPLYTGKPDDPPRID